MLRDSKAFSGFSVSSIPAAKDFYTQTLGLEAEENNGMLFLKLASGGGVLIYPKGDDHQPASYTVLNFPVPNIEQAMNELSSKGVTFEHYDGIEQDEKGIARGMGPAIAWFKDPSGNVLSIVEGEPPMTS